MPWYNESWYKYQHDLPNEVRSNWYNNRWFTDRWHNEYWFFESEQKKDFLDIHDLDH